MDGKAKLLRDDYCDGMGDCLPTCPTGAITFEEREAAAYDEAAVQENKKKKELQDKMKHMYESGCPGSRIRMMHHVDEMAAASRAAPESQLRNWPVQIKLAPINAPYFDGVNTMSNMFCYQCEQTAGCAACTGNAGVCGKKADTAALQDELTGALIGLARATEGTTVPAESTYCTIIEGLFTTITNVSFDNDAILIMIQKVRDEKHKLVPDCSSCVSPYGRNDEYDMQAGRL